MPIFEYRCGKCNHVVEQIHLSEPKAPKRIQCEECGGGARRVPASRVGVAFGNGFFQHNYASKSDRKAWMDNPTKDGVIGS
jgi:putative FmdB family regulatory protein